MKGLIDILSQERKPHFASLRLGIASPEKIRSWSYGEVRKPETINYRTFQPESDGLFCCKIFGPEKDYECLCGKYKRVKFRGVVCEKCNVEVTLRRVRRERMGHIRLACPVAHIWFFKSLPSRISMMLDMTMREVEQVLYFEKYIVIDPRREPDLQKGQLLTSEEYKRLAAESEGGFDAGIGAEGIRDILRRIDLPVEADALREDLKETTSVAKRKKIYKRLKLVETFAQSEQRPEWMILDILPVLPPELRPLVPLDGGRFTSSELNDLYRRVINRNNRLKRLLDLNAPEIIVNNEKRMLQESVDSLLDNSRRGKPATGPSKRPLKSLADIVKGKSGRFRQNLLGKRVDFSGRSVIVVGSQLKLHQCGLPKSMALELFRPFVFHALVKNGAAANIKTAKRMIDTQEPAVWDALESVTRQHPIMLNRAPTLHRLGIQAFEPVLIEGKAIQLHPLVCVAFNADFDGDQMAVHVPLSTEARMEARVLMLSSNNLLAPANGEPVMVPTQDIVLGVYYMTRVRDGAKGEGMRFCDIDEVERARAAGCVDLHARIQLLLQEGDDGEPQIIDTTAGRAILSRHLPPSVPFARINRVLKKSDLVDLVREVFERSGQRATALFVDRFMQTGFAEATRAGISICIQDMAIPAGKGEMLEKAGVKIGEIHDQWRRGLLTDSERYNKSVDLWHDISEDLTTEMMDNLSQEPVVDEAGRVLRDKNGKPRVQPSFNSIFMMADSGARGSQTQIKQLAGMRGLMTRPDGGIIETPIKANFREGLSVLEYFSSTHGARKGLTDTALKTANSGYLTRRLVDVTQDLVITENDCKTREGISIRAVLEGNDVRVRLDERIYGRVLARDVPHPQTRENLFLAGDYISTRERAKEIADAGVDEVFVRSPVTCATRRGICAKCYGRDLGRDGMVKLGEAVGVIAAQSIGEPGTQLTMRTFHIGGAASRESQKREIRASNEGHVRIYARYVDKSVEPAQIVDTRSLEGGRQTAAAAAPSGETSNPLISSSGELVVYDRTGRERERHRLRAGAVLKVADEAAVAPGQMLSLLSPGSTPIIAEFAGKAKFENIEVGVSAREQIDELTGRKYLVVTEGKQRQDKRSRKSWLPAIRLMDAKGREVCAPGTTNAVEIKLRPGMILEIHDGDQIRLGDTVARMPQQAAKSRDITGGLPRVAELFEARSPKEPSILARAKGQISLRGLVRNKQSLVITDESGREHQHLIAKDCNILVQDGTEVNRGEEIVDGDGGIDPHEILRLRGIEALTAHIVSEVQNVYRLQGVGINDKHIEVIIHQMLRCVEVVESGDSSFIPEEKIERIDADEATARLIAADKKQARFRDVLLGITKASLATSSFISAASFQETTKVLTEASISRRRDHLRGLKENVIVGRLVPAGTGFIRYLRNLPEQENEANISEMLRNELAEPEKTDAVEAVEESNLDPEAADKEVAEAAPDSADKPADNSGEAKADGEQAVSLS